MTSEAPQDVAALLRDLAEAATPGPWRYPVGGGVVGGGESAVDRRSVSVAFGEMTEPDGRYIAAASPDVVLGLLDQNDRLRSALRYLWNAELPIAAAIRAQQDVGDAMTVRDVFVHGIEGDPLVTDIDAVLAAR